MSSVLVASVTSTSTRAGAVLQVRQKPAEQIGRNGGHDAERDPKRAFPESPAHRLQHQCFVQDPLSLLVRAPSELGEKDAAAVALEQRCAEGGFQVANLKRQRRLRDEHALGGAAERAMFDDRQKITQLTQGDRHDSLLELR